MQTLAIRMRYIHVCTHARYVSHARYCYWWVRVVYVLHARLASQPYFPSCACALGRGAGEIPFPRPPPNEHAHEEKYGWLAILIGGLVLFTTRDRLPCTSLLRVSHWLATLLGSTRESILALRCNVWCLQGTQSWSK